MFSSWRTTLTGIGAIAGGIALVAKALTHDGGIDYDGFGAGATAIFTGIGLLCARDNRVTSEQAGAGK